MWAGQREGPLQSQRMKKRDETPPSSHQRPTLKKGGHDKTR